MREFPTGTVTFLFTDIEGSTRLIEELGEAGYVEALAEHRRALREIFSAHGGVEVDTQGDAFLYVFAEAGAAMGAAASVLDALAQGPVKVRMGLHTGESLQTGEGYAGRELHRAARIAAAGHGGQVVVSATTARVADGELTELGEHRLKDFPEPIALFQLGDEPFPPLRTISNTNLPRPASSLVGRERELHELTSLVRGDDRILTLTGPGGSGKSRLALAAAAELVPDFPAGVFWVGLAALSNPSLVDGAITEALGAKDGLSEHIGERELLLVLDNLEQLLDAAPEIASLVERCPRLRLLVTSRELLRVRGEIEYQVPPLAEVEAIELFCARAQVQPDTVVAELCRSLDQLPLALELAAARTNVLSPPQILERLSTRLDLFKGGRDADPRQRTLRATIEWSHDLLSPEEQELFRRLSVFAGGWTLEAAEEVSEADLDILQSLVDKSLVRHPDERFSMLETIREFARERLESSADCETIRRSHAEYFAGLVLRAAVRGGSTRDELRRERDNVRWAISYAAQTGDAELELSLLGLEGELMRDSMPNYRARLEELLPLAQAAPTEIRARAVGNLTFATYLMGDFTRARELAELELALAHETGEERLVGMALNSLSAPALALGDIEQARRALEQAGPLLEDVDPRSAAVNRVNLADILLTTGDYDKATRLCEEAAVMFARFGDASGRAIAEVNGATAAVLGARDDAFARVATALNGIPREDPYMLAVLIQLVAALAAGRRELEYAAGFQSTADRLRESVGVGLEPTEERVRDLVLSRLGSDWRPETTPSSADDDAAAQQAAAYLRTTAP